MGNAEGEIRGPLTLQQRDQARDHDRELGLGLEHEHDSAGQQTLYVPADGPSAS